MNILEFEKTGLWKDEKLIIRFNLLIFRISKGRRNWNEKSFKITWIWTIDWKKKLRVTISIFINYSDFKIETKNKKIR